MSEDAVPALPDRVEVVAAIEIRTTDGKVYLTETVRVPRSSGYLVFGEKVAEFMGGASTSIWSQFEIQTERERIRYALPEVPNAGQE